MPRISPSVIRSARNLDQRLVELLSVCRDLPSARNELRWLAEYATTKAGSGLGTHRPRLLEQYVNRRARGEPLQYILGTEYFGDLEIRCRPGVLIPRPETAASVSYLASVLLEGQLPAKLRVIDLCTGTGCIPLLLNHELRKHHLGSDMSVETVGVDISPSALALAKENFACQPSATEPITFLQADVLEDDNEPRLMDMPSLRTALHAHHGQQAVPKYEILISNPPYISPQAFRTTTARSVRHYEPRLALVPSYQYSAQSGKVLTLIEDNAVGDLFYPAILRHAKDLDVKIMLLEVGDLAQGLRVADKLIRQGVWDHVEMWRDEPRTSRVETITAGGAAVNVRGTGSGRSVFACRGAGRRWLMPMICA